MAIWGNLPADPLPPPVSAPDTAPLPDNSGAAANPATDSAQTPANPQSANTPLIPQQSANPYQPLTSSSTTTQSPQLTAPGLYTTGANDLSQIATSNGLTQAFSEVPTSGFLSETGIDYSHGPIERLRLGPIDLKAALLMNVVNDDNIQAGEVSGRKISDTSFSFTPAVLLEYGAQEGQKGYASLVYAPTLTRYLHYSNNNSDNQNVALNLQYPFQKLTLDFSEAYTQVTGLNTDLNARTTQTSSLTTLGGNYDIDDKLSFSSHLQEVITSYAGGDVGSGQEAGVGDQTSSINSALLYHLSEKITLGPGLNLGLDKPQDVKQQSFEQALMVLNYQPTEKINLFAQGGAEFRQGIQNASNNPGGPDRDETNPIFSFGAGYTPFDSTSLSVNAYRNVHASSADSTQTVVDTGVGFSASQRFVQRVYLNFNFNYSHNETQSGSGQSGGIPTTAGSSQDLLSYRPSLSFAPTAWSSLALYYQYLDNSSNAPGGTYHDNQLGVSVSVQF